MRGGNPLIQFSQELVAGYSRPENAAAAQMLMVGWANDMFAGTQDDGIYLDPSQEFNAGHPCGRGHPCCDSQLADEAVPVEPAAGARTAGKWILHVRTDVRLRLHGRGQPQGADGCLTP
jgi:hypothetical protein